MPVAPYTWQPSDFPSAARLQQELRQYKGLAFTLNGVGFHARRPVYKSYASSTPAHTATTFFPFASSAGTWNQITDPAAFNGGQLDFLAEGGLNGNFIFAGGGSTATGGNGGYGIVASYFPWSATTNTVMGSGNGTIVSASPTVFGTFQPTGASSISVTTMAVSLMNLDTTSSADFVTGYAQSSVNTLPLTPTQTDGSGITARTHGFWASGYSQFGTTVAGIPSIPVVGLGSSIANTDLNTSIAQTLNLLNMPPALQVRSGSQSSLTSTPSQVLYSSGTVDVDTYGAFTKATSTYTVPISGNYLVYMGCAVNSFSANSYIFQQMVINSTALNSPINATISGEAAGSCGVRILPLNAGDTIKHFAASGVASTTSNSAPAVMVVLWLGAKSEAGNDFWDTTGPPDDTYRFAAGTPGQQLGDLFNRRVFGDLNSLLYRPYAHAYQSAAQSMTQASDNTVNLQTTTSIINSDPNVWGSWSAGVWTAPADGYYLVAGEIFNASSTPGGGPNTALGFKPFPAGLATDLYQHNLAATTVSGGGSCGLAIYYLLAGDSISLINHPTNLVTSGTSTSYVSGTAWNSHMDVIWLSN